MSVLIKLDTESLKNLVYALNESRLVAPFNSLSLQKYVGNSLAGEVAAELTYWANKGLDGKSLGKWLELLLNERQLKEKETSSVELVVTGPETPLVPLRDTWVVLNQIFKEAKESVLVVGYAIYQGKKIFRALSDKMEYHPEIEVTLVLDIKRDYRDTSLSSEIVKRFSIDFFSKSWPGRRQPVIYYFPASLSMDQGARACLHAKCVVVDRKVAFITSANLTEAAQQRNIEVGVLLRSAELAMLLHDHFSELMRTGVLQRLPSVGR